MTTKEWMDLVCRLSPTHARVAIGLHAFNPDIPQVWEARRLLIAATVGIAVEEVDAALEAMVEVGLAEKGWLQ